MTAGKHAQQPVDSPGQLRIDWTRAQQLAAIRSAELLPVRVTEGTRVVSVTPLAMKSVLKTIDDHGRGREAWLSYETLAVESGCSLRTAKRAVQGLQTLSLLCVRTPRSKREAHCNHYRIVWSELDLLRGKQSATAHPEQSATGTKQSATGTKQSATGGTLRAREEPENRRPLPPESITDTSQAGDRWAAAELALRRTGLEHVASTVRIAQQRGLTPAEVIHLVETYEAQPRLFSTPGAIRIRIRDDAWPVAGVQDPRAIREAAAAQEAARREREAQARRDADAAQASRVELQALEAAYGAELDALDRSQLEALARMTFQTPFALTRFRRNPDNCRYDLLVAIHANRTAAESAAPARPPPVRVGSVAVRDGRLVLRDSEG